MPKRLIKWALASTVLTAGVMALAGRWNDPWLWAYAASWWGTTFYAMMSIDEDLARERFSPPSWGADRLSLRVIRLLALAHLVVGALDNRWHLGPAIPAGMRGLALAGMTVGYLLFFRSMRENRFFSAVVRVQSERGHRVVTTGPYSIVRHPGYAGMIASVPLSGLALESWAGAAIGLAYSAMILRRVAFEDSFLHRSLGGYADYARRVPYRLVPGVW
jgi:protein-S-isoprenylcysteine O-methyltransferase Ste14